jgi:tetratricopeptide (TPR) repeat protein
MNLPVRLSGGRSDKRSSRARCLRRVTVLGLALLALAAQEASDHTPYRATVRGTVWIRTGRVLRDGKPLYPGGSGTGWIADRDRKLVITNHHVVAGQGGVVYDTVSLTFPVFRPEGQLVSEKSYYEEESNPGARPRVGRVIDTDPKHDLALIKLDSLPDGALALPLAPQGAQPGERVHSVGGNPVSSQALWVYTQGVVRQVYARGTRLQSGREVDYRLIETQSPINPGDSGSALVNDRGQVVGVNSSIDPTSHLVSHAIELDEVKLFLRRAEAWLTPASAEDFKNRGIHYLHAGRNAPAIEDFTRALAGRPEDVGLHRLLGTARLHAGQIDPALDELTYAVTHDPRDSLAWRTRGQALAGKGKLEEALRDLERAEALNPGDPELYQARAVIYERLGRWPEAVECYTDVLDLEPNNAPAHLLRGNAYARLHNDAEAIDDYSRALALGSRTEALFLCRAQAYCRTGDYTKAASDCAVVLQQGGAPHKPLALTIFGEVFAGKGEHARAIPLYDQALKLDGRLARAYDARGLSRSALNDLPHAIADHTQAIQLASKTDPAARAASYFHRGMARTRAGRTSPAEYPRALEDFDRALQLDANLAAAHLARAEVLRALHHHDEAQAALDRLLQREPKNAAAYNLRGLLHADRQRYAEAVPDFTKSLQLGRSPEAYYNRGRAVQALGRHREAVADFSQAIALYAGYVAAYQARGESYEALGQARQAASDREKVSQLKQK